MGGGNQSETSLITQLMLGPLQEAEKRQNIWDNCTVKFLKTFDVIGMTVTGAASRLHLLGMCLISNCILGYGK